MSKGGLINEFLLRAALKFGVFIGSGGGGGGGGGGGVTKGAVVFDEQFGDV